MYVSATDEACEELAKCPIFKYQGLASFSQNIQLSRLVAPGTSAWLNSGWISWNLHHMGDYDVEGISAFLNLENIKMLKSDVKIYKYHI